MFTVQIVYQAFCEMCGRDSLPYDQLHWGNAVKVKKELKHVDGWFCYKNNWYCPDCRKLAYGKVSLRKDDPVRKCDFCNLILNEETTHSIFCCKDCYNENFGDKEK